MRSLALFLATLSLLAVVQAQAAPAPEPAHLAWRGVFFNPQVQSDPNFPWLLFYAQYGDKVRPR